MSESVHIVIAHYNENLDWLQNVNYPYTVISRKGIPKETPPNRGNEASSYLEWIISNYNNLPDVAIFVHGHRSDWHHLQNMDDRLKTITFNYDYLNINNGGLNIFKNFHNEKNILNSVKDVFAETCGDINVDDIQYRCSAQFYVKNHLILKHSINAYKQLYNWLMTTQMNTYYNSRMLEYTWHIIFTGNHIDNEGDDASLLKN